MTSTSVAAEANPIEKSAIRKVIVRLVPFVALMFFINYLDRTAISFAKSEGMESDLALTAAQYGFASGIFFLGYILLEVPSNIALHRFGARRWLARIMVTWGIVAVLFTWVNSYTQLSVLRFLLGVAEAGFFPGAILFLSLWVPARYRSKVLGFFYLAQPLTSVIGAPLAGWLMTHEVLDLEGWRFMFLGVGAPAIIIGVVAWFYLADSPKQAKWLTPQEQQWLTDELERESRGKVGDTRKGHFSGMGAAFGSGRVWILSFIYFGFIYGLYTLAFFLPTIISDIFGKDASVMEKAVITAIPYAPAAVVLYLCSRHASKFGVSTWHIALPAAIGAVSIPLALFAGSAWLTVGLVAITACAIFGALPNFWTVPTQFLAGAAAAAGIALINTMGNLAGFLAPWLTGKFHDALGDYKVAMFVVGGFMALSAVLMVVLAKQGKVNTDVEVAEPAGH